MSIVMSLFNLFLFLLQDPLVSQTKRDNYRCRSAYKLIELDNKYHFLNKGTIAVRIVVPTSTLLMIVVLNKINFPLCS